MNVNVQPVSVRRQHNITFTVCRIHDHCVGHVLRAHCRYKSRHSLQRLAGLWKRDK